MSIKKYESKMYFYTWSAEIVDKTVHEGSHRIYATNLVKVIMLQFSCHVISAGVLKSISPV